MTTLDTIAAIIDGLKAGGTLVVDRRDSPILPKLLELERQGKVRMEFVEYDEQSSALKFRWVKGRVYDEIARWAAEREAGLRARVAELEHDRAVDIAFYKLTREKRDRAHAELQFQLDEASNVARMNGAERDALAKECELLRQVEPWARAAMEELYDGDGPTDAQHNATNAAFAALDAHRKGEGK